MNDTALNNRYTIYKEDTCKESTRGCDKGRLICVAINIALVLCQCFQLEIKIPLVKLSFASKVGLKKIPKKRPAERAASKKVPLTTECMENSLLKGNQSGNELIKLYSYLNW